MAPSGGTDVYESPARVSRWRISETASGEGGVGPPLAPALPPPKLPGPAPALAEGRGATGSAAGIVPAICRMGTRSSGEL
jgi:hypothetical protein